MNLIHFALDAVRCRPAFGVVASARVYSQSTEVRACDAFEMGFAADLLAHLAECDERRLHLDLGFASLFAYCTKSLGFCEATAWRRITAARVCRRFPEAFAASPPCRICDSGAAPTTSGTRKTASAGRGFAPRWPSHLGPIWPTAEQRRNPTNHESVPVPVPRRENAGTHMFGVLECLVGAGLHRRTHQETFVDANDGLRR
jgi:hypothetical protein